MSGLPKNISLDLADLLEYDEFDSFEAARDLPSPDNEIGVPLSVELSDSMCQISGPTTVPSQTPFDGGPNDDGFVKSAEIFLRLDSDNDSGTTTTITIASGSLNSKQSLDSTGGGPSSGQFSSIDCDIELQYENEFFDPNNDECNFVTEPSTVHRRSTIEIDNEQLLLEGITLFSFLSTQLNKNLHLVSFWFLPPFCRWWRA